jgi:hypothetical protein
MYINYLIYASELYCDGMLHLKIKHICVGCEVLTAVVMKVFVSGEIELHSPLEVNMLDVCLAYSSVVKMGTVCSSNMFLNFQRATWHCIPEDVTLHKMYVI